MTAVVEEGVCPAPVSERVDPAARGVTRVTDKAIATIVEAAAKEVDGVLDAETAGRRRSDPSARVDVHDERVEVEVALDVEYPTPVRSLARSVRDQAIRRLSELAGVEVDTVHVRIRAMRPPRFDHRVA